MNYKTKPRFKPEQVERLVDLFHNEMTLGGQTYDSKTDEALNKYVQARKNIYENTILEGVLEGKYRATIIKTNGRNEVGYKVARPNGLPKEQYQQTLEQRSSLLSHALNMVAVYGGSPKLEL